MVGEVEKAPLDARDIKSLGDRLQIHQIDRVGVRFELESAFLLVKRKVLELERAADVKDHRVDAPTSAV